MISFCQEIITCTILVPARLAGHDVTKVLNTSDHMHDRDPTMKVCNTFPYHPSRTEIHIGCTYVDRVRVGCSTFIRELHTSTIHIWDRLEIQTESEFRIRRKLDGSGVMGLITIITSFHFGSWRCALSFPFFLHCPLYVHVHMGRCWCPSVYLCTCIDLSLEWNLEGGDLRLGGYRLDAEDLFFGLTLERDVRTRNEATAALFQFFHAIKGSVGSW